MNDDLIALEKYQELYGHLGAQIMDVIENFEARGIDYTNRDTMGPLMLATQVKVLVDSFKQQEPKL